MNNVDDVRSESAIRNVVVVASRWATFICIAAMTLLMVVEVFMRYFAGAPLGWNISMIQNVLLPGLLFLGLPWAYATGAHVTADLVYDRLPYTVQNFARALAVIVVIIGLVGLLVAGALSVYDAFVFGDAPPPLSARIALPAWTWKMFMPLGAAATLLVMIIDLLKNPRRS